jgi:hypothetical protein
LFNERNDEMKRVATILAATALVLPSLTGLALGQQSQPQQQPQRPTEGQVEMKQMRIIQSLEAGQTPLPPPPPGADFLFVASENFGGKVVKGAPYSAEAVSETVQTLSDGNRIVNKTTSQIYRDSEGRTRREQTLKALGGVGAGEEPLQTIFINDPVAGVTYLLDSRTHIAHKSVPFTFELKSGAGDGQKFEFKTNGPSGTSIIVNTPNGAPPAGARVAVPEGGGETFNIRTEGTASYVLRTKTGPNANEVKEQLGKQSIEGIEAEGTRTTVTIPAGEIGNDRAIEIVSERWYSPELQLVVMTKHSDPRFGETTYKLTNINRSEPAKSLFEPPPGFTVKEMRTGVPFTPVPTRRKNNPE